MFNMMVLQRRVMCRHDVEIQACIAALTWRSWLLRHALVTERRNVEVTWSVHWRLLQYRTNTCTWLTTLTKQWCVAGSAPGGGHPLHDGLVCSRQPSSSTRRNQYNAVAALAHNDAMTSPAETVSKWLHMALSHLCANVTSFIKPEVHSVSQRRQRPTCGGGVSNAVPVSSTCKALEKILRS